MMSVGYPYEDWDAQGIDLSQYEDQCAEWWNKLVRYQRFQFFPWATGQYWSDKVQFAEEYIMPFEELESDIREQIVEKYAVQKGLVIPTGMLPNWNQMLRDSDREILAI